METAVLIEPYACGKHAVDRGEIKNNDVVVLSGPALWDWGCWSLSK